jgi:hypothetical protein
MTSRAVSPSEVSSAGCVLTGRRFHHWTLSFVDPQSSGLTDLERKCVDCDRRQHTRSVPESEMSVLPRALWCLGDWQWHDGELQP